MIYAGLTEAAGLSRIYQHRKKCQSGTISAFRTYSDLMYAHYDWDADKANALSEGDKLDYLNSLQDNLKRDKALRAEFKKYRGKLGYIRINGMYKEEGMEKASKEASYFVYALDNTIDLKAILIELGRKFNQDSITYAKADGNYELICSTRQKYIRNDLGQKVKAGDVIARFKGVVWGGNDSKPEFDLIAYSKIRGRCFTWDNYQSVSIEESTIQSFKTQSQNTRIKSSSSIMPGVTPVRTRKLPHEFADLRE